MNFWEVVRDVINPAAPRTEEIKQCMQAETERLRGLRVNRQHTPVHYLDDIAISTEEATKFT